MKKADLIFEIGVEEMPAGYLELAKTQLEKIVKNIFDRERLVFDHLEVWTTPRRMALYLTNLSDRQKDKKEEIKGPAQNTAYDEDGNPTKAAEGFARSKGISVDDLETKETARGDYVFAVTTEHGKQTEDVLSEILPEVISSLEFPKTMSWKDYDFQFARPIRWLLAVYGNNTIHFSLAGVESENLTEGHRFLGNRVEINDPKDYLNQLRDQFVIVDNQERRETIKKQIDKHARESNGQVFKDKQLLEEVNNLVEYPVALKGSFNSDYLSLPGEVLVTVMRKHQRYFSIIDENKELLPYFITVSNGGSDNPDLIRAGNEKVLRARLSDARFFYDEDKKIPLQDQIKELKKIVFQKKLGTVFDKVQRITQIAEYLSLEFNLNQEQKDDLKKAAELCKSDLSTLMVKEFPELQGVMGGVYARLSGEKENVAQAVEEHYLPVRAEDELPKSFHGLIISIADKMDTITGCLGIGIEPSGSQDPYALRRKALAVIRMLLDLEVEVSFEKLLEYLVGFFDSKELLHLTKEETKKRIEDIFAQRFSYLLAEKGYSSENINAVMSSPWDTLSDAEERVNLLEDCAEEDYFSRIVMAYKRVSRMVDNLDQKSSELNVKPELFKNKAEKKLYNNYLNVYNMVKRESKKEDYNSVLIELSDMSKIINEFFEKVMVMADEEELRRNRLLMLTRIKELFYAVADFSKIHLNNKQEN